MTQKQVQELKQSQSDFHRLKKDQQLPPLMELKLSFLQAIINGTSNAHDFGEKLQVAERESIESMSKETQIRLFIEIVRCLACRDVVTYCFGERTYLRREGKFFPWQKCYLTCNTNHLLLYPKRNAQEYLCKYQLQKLNLSRSYKKYKKKFILAVYYQNSKQALGFDEQITCKRIHRIIADLLEQKRYWQVTKYDNVKFNEERQAQRMALPAHKIQQIMDHQQYQRLMSFEEKVAQIAMLREQGYKLSKNMQEGRVLVSNKWVRTQIIVKGVTPLQAASCYIQMSEWNPSVSSFEITSKPRTNCLTALLKTAKYSMISYQREAAVAINYLRFCQCHEQKSSNRSLLLIEDIPSEHQIEGIRMNFKQVVQFLPNKQDKTLLMINISTEATFNGYCNEVDNINMSLHLVEHVQKLFHFINQNKEKFNGFLEEVPCPCGGKESLQFLADQSLPTQRNSFEQNENPLQKAVHGYEINQKRVLATLEDICNGVINEQFLEMIKNKVHQKYYLKHRFTEAEQRFRMYEGPVKNFLSEGTRWKLQKDEFMFIDDEALSMQKDVLKMILKQISSNLMRGKSIMNMSLPVQIFDRKSFVDAVADSYGFVPVYADKIVQAKDPIEQMKYMACALMFVHATSPNIEKPFNPILGETYQGMIGSYPVYLEQISHHPPISALLIKTKDFQFSANVEVVIDMGLNSLNSFINHWLRAKVYSTNTEYLIKIPDINMEGIMYGNRTYKVTGKGFILEVNSNLCCQLSIGKDKKRVYESKSKVHYSDLMGGIFKVKEDFTEKIKSKPKMKSFQGLKPEHIIETCCFLSGKWYGDLFFDGVQYKSKSQGPFPFRSERMKYLLPSDSIWREDLIHKIWKDNQRSNREKERLENIQRNDRKLREKHKKGK